MSQNTSEETTLDVRGWIGQRCVRILELVEGWAVVQPWDQPRTWQLVQADLVVMERPRRALSGEAEVTG